mgnify:FL=1
MGKKRYTFEGMFNGVMILSHREQPEGRTEGMLHYSYDKTKVENPSYNPKDYRARFCPAISSFNVIERLHCVYGRHP